MKHTCKTILTGCCLTFLFPLTGFSEEPRQAVAEMGKKTSMHFMKELKGKLQAAMKEGGPLNAIEVCSGEALNITAEASEAAGEGVEIKRTTNKYRNPANAPDKLEKEALDHFEKKLKETGELPPAFIQKTDTGFRFYKSLTVGKLCLKCHGDPASMPQKVVEKLDSLYPDDKARGYREGDFRGVIRVSIPRELVTSR